MVIWGKTKVVRFKKIFILLSGHPLLLRDVSCLFSVLKNPIFTSSFPLIRHCYRKQATTKFYFSFSICTWICSLGIPLQEGSSTFDKVSAWVGIIAIKTERTQIHFLSDVLIADASLDVIAPWCDLCQCQYYCGNHIIVQWKRRKRKIGKRLECV